MPTMTGQEHANHPHGMQVALVYSHHHHSVPPSVHTSGAWQVHCTHSDEHLLYDLRYHEQHTAGSAGNVPPTVAMIPRPLWHHKRLYISVI